MPALQKTKCPVVAVNDRRKPTKPGGDTPPLQKKDHAKVSEAAFCDIIGAD
jgi:hypothetical protein